MLNRLISARHQRGQVLLLVTFLMVPLIGMLGLVTDVGYMYYVKKSAQAAADSAVLSAIARFHSENSGSAFDCTMSGVSCYTNYQCPVNPTATNPIGTACLYAKQNGFTASGNQNVLVDSNVGSTPPSGASGVNNTAFWITVRVSQRVPQLFAAITGNPTGLVSARATAALTPSKDCIYVLDPSISGAYYQNGSTTVQSACGLYINSSSPTAMTNSGNSILTAPEYDIVGSYEWHGTLTPNPNTGAPTTQDPLKNLPVPSPCSSAGGCAGAGCSASSGTLNVNSNQTLNPGVYCGGIHVGNATATFSGGTYILVGGGLSTQSTNSIIRTTGGVTFYNTYDSHHDYTGMDLNANSDVQMTAPTSGTYAGVLFMGDRNWTGAMPYETLQGGPNAKFEGIIYMPKSHVRFAGNPTITMAHYTLFVVRQLEVLGNSTVNNDYSVLSGGNPIQTVGLIE